MDRLPTRNELIDAYQTLSGRLLDAAGVSARSSFLTLPDWRDDNIPGYIEQVVSMLTATKQQAAQLASAFYAEIAKLDGQTFSAPVLSREELTTSALRNGADTVQVWSRPFVEMRTALAAGSTIADALDAGAFRAQDLARTEVQLARRGAGLSARKRNSNIVGYIRTLSGSENCALCYLASTQRYHKRDLQPIHPGCDCGEMPIYGTTDVGQVIDETRLSATHEAVAARFNVADAGGRTIDYSKIAIREHGELGPVLTVADQNFTGPNDLPPARTWG